MKNKPDQKQQSRGERKRRHLFDLFSQNLNFIRPDLEGLFMCPLCLNLFTLEALSQTQPNPLTLEDVPPKSLGGKVRTLTCKTCNNKKGGGKLETDIKKKLQMDEFLAGVPGSFVNARFRPHPDVNLAATIHFDGRLLDIIYDDSNLDKSYNIDKFYELEAKRSISQIELDIYKGYKIRRFEASLLRAAYLWAFSLFGYGFLINPNLQYIRDQIEKPTESILPEWWGITKGSFPDESLGVNIIIEPKELQAFLVIFDVLGPNQIIRYGILLPGPSEPGANVYYSVPRKQDRQKDFVGKFKTIPVPRYDYLKDSNLRFASQIIWNEYRSNT